MKNAITTTKRAFEIGNITKIMQGHKKTVRIDAVARNYQEHPDTNRFFSKWVSEKYANRLCQEFYGKNVNQMNTYRY